MSPNYVDYLRETLPLYLLCKYMVIVCGVGMSIVTIAWAIGLKSELRDQRPWWAIACTSICTALNLTVTILMFLASTLFVPIPGLKM